MKRMIWSDADPYTEDSYRVRYGEVKVVVDSGYSTIVEEAFKYESVIGIVIKYDDGSMMECGVER